MHQSRSTMLVPDVDPMLARCVVILIGVTTLCIVAIDEPFARFLATRDTLPAIWDGGITILEYLAGIEPWKWLGVCVLVGGVLLAVALPRLRSFAPAIMFTALSHLLARNVMMWGKLATGRLRPTEWLAHGGGRTFFRDGFSFPSGHVILFGSLALAIAMVWPRTRFAMYAVIAFVIIARVAVNAHFLSDVTAGLAVTLAAAWLSARLVHRAYSSQTPPASPR